MKRNQIETRLKKLETIEDSKNPQKILLYINISQKYQEPESELAAFWPEADEPAERWESYRLQDELKTNGAVTIWISPRLEAVVRKLSAERKPIDINALLIEQRLSSPVIDVNYSEEVQA